MANMMALNTVYNHYLTTYARGSVSKYDTHKKSELRSIYHSIVKLNKESPLYLPDTTKESRIFAIGLKENSRELHNVIASLGGMDEEELLNKKAAFSTNEDMLTAQHIGKSTGSASEDGSISETDIPSYEIEVRSLASPQTNLGSFLPADEMGLETGTYSFDIGIHNMNYEFQYNITENDTNKTVQEKLARLISGAEIGILANVETDNGLSALRLTSAASGAPVGKDSIFSVSDDRSSKTSGSVDYFGIAETTRPASNAELVINGVPRSVSSNHFTLEKTYELTLHGVSPIEGQTATVSVKNDTESIKENINRLVNGYNTFLHSASEHGTEHTRDQSLLREMRGIASIYKDGLNHMGLSIHEDGSLSLDAKAYENALEGGDPRETLSVVKDFADSLLRKTNQISLNPMKYVDRTIVAYKNPGKNFATPYITSPYSGMLFNSYC